MGLKYKKGSEKYYILISLVLGLIILGLSLYFIFNEYFTSDDINRETCRQSIVLRDGSPDLTAAGTNIAKIKDAWPLKCRTEVVKIDYKNVTKAEEEIGDEFIFCWNIFGYGNFRIFPEYNWATHSSCVPCARIHFEAKVRDYYVKDYVNPKTKAVEDNRINFQRLFMVNKVTASASYYDYLQDVGGHVVRTEESKGDVEAFIGRIAFHETGRGSSNLYVSKSGKRIEGAGDVLKKLGRE